MAKRSKKDAEVTERLLDSLLVHRLEFVRTFLDGHAQRKSGTRRELRERLKDFINESKTNRLLLAQLLDQIEGWGRQQVYLLKPPAGLVSDWRDRGWVERTLKEGGVTIALNKARPVLLPERMTLTHASWNEQRVRFTWTEKRRWEDADPSSDYVEGDTVFYAYARRLGRATTTFEMDLVSSLSQLSIQQLPIGTDTSANYEKARQAMVVEMSPYLDLSKFKKVSLGAAIDALKDSDEVRHRQCSSDTPKGGCIRLTSSSRKTSIRDDPVLRKAEAAAGGDTVGHLSNCYWLVERSGSVLSREVRTTIHAEDDRIGIFGDLREEEARYVIGRIRFHLS